MHLRALARCSILALLLAPAAARSQGWTLELVDAPNGWQVFGAPIALDPAGGPHIAYWTPTYGLRYASRDGSPWTLSPVVAHSSPAASASPASAELINTWSSSLVIDAAGTPHIAIGNSNWDSYQLIYWTRDSLGWVSSSPGTSYGGYPSIALDAAGQPRILALQKGSSDLEYLERNAGSWSVDPLAVLSYFQLPLAIDGEGVPHVGYASGGVLYDLWRDGIGWHSETVDSASVGAVAVGVDGLVRMAYAGSTGALTLAERGPSGWSHVVVDPSGDGVGEVALALDRHDEPRIVFRDVTLKHLRYASSYAGAWSFTTVDTTSDAGYFLSLALAADGTPHVAYAYDNLLRLGYARGTSTTGVPQQPLPGQGALRVAPNPVRVGQAVSIAVSLAAPDRVGLELLDLAGRSIASRPPEEFGVGLTSRTWSPPLARPGIYLVRWRAASGRTGSQRLVVLR